MAHKKSTGSTKSGRDSRPKYLGVKVYHNGKVKTGYILVRQRGTKYQPGENVAAGKDWTLYALKEGTVKFETKQKISFSGKKKKVKVVKVV